MKATPIKPGQVYRVSGFGAQIDVIATNAMRALQVVAAMRFAGVRGNV